MDKWLSVEFPQCSFVRCADDAIIFCRSQNEGQTAMKAASKRLAACGLEMHASRTRLARNSIRGEWFTNFLPAVSIKALKAMNEKMREWKVLN